MQSLWVSRGDEDTIILEAFKSVIPHKSYEPNLPLTFQNISNYIYRREEEKGVEK